MCSDACHSSYAVRTADAQQRPQKTQHRRLALADTLAGMAGHPREQPYPTLHMRALICLIGSTATLKLHAAGLGTLVVCLGLPECLFLTD